MAFSLCAISLRFKRITVMYDDFIKHSCQQQITHVNHSLSGPSPCPEAFYVQKTKGTNVPEFMHYAIKAD